MAAQQSVLFPEEIADAMEELQALQAQLSSGLGSDQQIRGYIDRVGKIMDYITKHSASITNEEKRFRDLLKQSHINNPDHDTISMIVYRHQNELNQIVRDNSSANAVDLYMEVKSKPPIRSKGYIVGHEKDFSIDGPLSPELNQLLKANDFKNRECILIKLLPVPQVEHHVPQEEKEFAITAEARTCEELSKHEHASKCASLVPYILVTIDITDNRHLPVPAGRQTALMMPHYVSSLTARPIYNESSIQKGLHEILAAVRAMHSAGFVHADIKSDNVFVNHDSSWRLGDFGSARKLGRRLYTVTKVLNPYYIPQGATATFDMDFVSICVMIAYELLKNKDWKVLCGKKERVQPSLIIEVLESIEHRSLRNQVVALFQKHYSKARDHFASFERR